MSIHIYRTAAELDGTAAKKRKVGRFSMGIGFRNVAQGRRMIRKVDYTVVGETDDAVEQHAVWMAENLLKVVSGEIMFLWKKMGHYRKDQVCPVLAPNRKLYTVMKSTANDDEVENHNVELVNNRVFIPFADLTEVQVAALQEKKTYNTDEEAGLGYVRWLDQDQSELEAFYTDKPLGRSIKNDLFVQGEELLPPIGNISAGDADGWVDEAA